MSAERPRGDFPGRLRTERGLVGYWIGSDNPPAVERIATLGFDYLCLDLQHGLIDEAGSVRALMAIDAAFAVHGTVGVVRVRANDATAIGRALDAGAAGVIVPMVNTAEEAAQAVAACRYPPGGQRSFGPVRSSLRIGPDPEVADRSVACVVMIETAEGLANLEQIAAVPGLDGLYVGPSDLALAIGARTPAEGWADPAFATALSRIRAAAEAAGCGCGAHMTSGELAAEALEQGFSFVSLSDDLAHLQEAARHELAQTRRQPVAG